MGINLDFPWIRSKVKILHLTRKINFIYLFFSNFTDKLGNNFESRKNVNGFLQEVFSLFILFKLCSSYFLLFQHFFFYTNVCNIYFKFYQDWWRDLLQDNYKDIDYSGKMVLLLDVLKMCSGMGDKVLVFSQSIATLDLIELYLSKLPRKGKTGKCWRRGKDWYRCVCISSST